MTRPFRRPSCPKRWLLAALWPAIIGCSGVAPSSGTNEPRGRELPRLDVAGSSTERAGRTGGLRPLGGAAMSGGRGTAVADDDVAGRVGSLRYITWIHERADVRSKKLGYVRTGTTVQLAQAERVDGWGNCRGFFAVEPRGYVCNDDSATTDMGHPVLRAARHVAPVSDAVPYEWALSLGAPMYNRVPTAAEHARVMRRHGAEKVDGWVKKYAGLAREQPLGEGDVRDPIPDFLRHGRSTPTPFSSEPALVRKTIPIGSIVAYTKVFRENDEVWLLSTDLTVVPANRFRPYEANAVRGTALGDGTAELPIAWPRDRPRPKHRRRAGGAFEPTGESHVRLSHVPLTGARAKSGKHSFRETKEGTWIDEADAAIVERRSRPRHVRADEKWMVVAVTQGTLAAYEGDDPVYATLMSPGSGGVQPPGGDPVKLSTTPLGSYRVTWKDLAAGMSPDAGDPTTFWIQDVPWTMYFDAPFALHAAFWHDELGHPKSGGCVNLSLHDARRLFEWAGPDLPEGWQGVAHGGPNGVGAHVIVVP